MTGLFDNRQSRKQRRNEAEPVGNMLQSERNMPSGWEPPEPPTKPVWIRAGATGFFRETEEERQKRQGVSPRGTIAGG